jgi:hypothetical protein
MNFFVWLGERAEGPYDEMGVQKMLHDGGIDQDTLVRPEEGDLNWTPVRELFPQDLSPKSDVQRAREETEQTDDGARLHIRLSSGAELSVKAVCLYDEFDLGKISARRSEGLKKLGGVSTGLGAIGSVEWVLAASVVIGAAEALLSAGASSEGTRLLQEAMSDERRLRKEGVFCAVGKIQDIETPVPGLWRVPTTERVSVRVPGFLGPKMEDRNLNSALIHNGDEFISVLTEDGAVFSIRWDAVESYRRIAGAAHLRP